MIVYWTRRHMLCRTQHLHQLQVGVGLEISKKEKWILPSRKHNIGQITTHPSGMWQGSNTIQPIQHYDDIRQNLRYSLAWFVSNASELVCKNHLLNVIRQYKFWDKSNPITGLDRSSRFQEGEAPRFRDNRHMKVVSPTHRSPLPPRKYSWYSFLLEAESTPGPYCGWKDYVNEKFQWHHRESNPRSSDL